jgi:hypothetical protein
MNENPATIDPPELDHDQGPSGHGIGAPPERDGAPTTAGGSDPPPPEFPPPPPKVN